MRNFNKALLLIAALGLAACNNPNRYGGGAGGAGGASAGLNGAGGISGQGLGDVSNPASIAYFNQRVGDRVFFKLDQSNLSPDAQQTLVKQAQWLNQYPSYGIIIEGHTDERGTREYNIALGARRAQVVKDFLSTHGVTASRIRTISYGKERPVATCTDESCYSQNRRAVTVLSQGQNS